MGFIEEWNEAIASDPCWQYEDLMEEDPELAEGLGYLNWVYNLASKRLAMQGIYITPVELFEEMQRR